MDEIVPSREPLPHEVIIAAKSRLGEIAYNLMYDGAFLGPAQAREVILAEHADLVRQVPVLCDKETGEPVLGQQTVKKYAEKHRDELVRKPRRTVAETMWAAQLQGLLVVQNLLRETIMATEQSDKKGNLRFAKEFSTITGQIIDILPGVKAAQRFQLESTDGVVTDADRKKWMELQKEALGQLQAYEQELLGTGTVVDGTVLPADAQEGTGTAERPADL